MSYTILVACIVGAWAFLSLLGGVEATRAGEAKRAATASAPPQSAEPAADAA